MNTSQAWQKLVAMGYKPKRLNRKHFAFSVVRGGVEYFFTDAEKKISHFPSRPRHLQAHAEQANTLSFLSLTTDYHRVVDGDLIVHADIVFYPKKEIGLHYLHAWMSESHAPYIKYKGEKHFIPREDKLALKLLEDKAYYPLFDYVSEKATLAL